MRKREKKNGENLKEVKKPNSEKIEYQRLKKEEKRLIELAKESMENAYAPYSHFKVGAVLVTKNGKIFTGVNVENASYGLTNCAERTAIFKAVSEGEREFEKIVIVANTDEPVSPCGACRQVMAEFGNFEVILTNTKGELIKTTVKKLLPYSFKKDDLDKAK